ncbi:MULTISPECIES: aminopeptidase [Haloarcula]|uniref:Aminopeptidase n=1 Tax=Haloarcula pellucida TaxID=1427151 RepID=A0A830GP38_9EURY|nr:MULTISPECIES: aminopeptidase [Halomicroarcula]MBX0349094.1 aminopeptidase [Halomicroarcula pellucida]MDS0279313.1 aminopeptidase [Halomicroarcula sp. S1AR25-4]GGN98987.1 aminopeptidase [Halomicroarcula pellucida]
MDERVREHARTLVDWSARIEAGDDVVVQVDEGAHDLAVAVAAHLGTRGANLLSTYSSAELRRAYLRAHDGAFDADPEYELAMYERADSVLILKGSTNTAGTADVPSERRQAHSKARRAIREARLHTDWVSTQHPTRAMAQQAGMAYEAYEDFVYDATLRDWEALAEEQAQLKELLDAGDTVRIVTDGTDLTMSIEGRTAVNSAASVAYDSHNLPSGEVFTAPEGTEGVVTFDVPMTIQGRRVRDVELTFEDGVVVDFAAEQGEAVIEEVLATDDGARRLGELGIGMNRGVDRVTDNILFDEKMGGTVHLALGRAYDACLPDGVAGNDSAVHEDLITTMGAGSRLEVDGDVVQEDGKFRWE